MLIVCVRERESTGGGEELNKSVEWSKKSFIFKIQILSIENTFNSNKRTIEKRKFSSMS